MKWNTAKKDEGASELARRLGVSVITAKLIRNRGAASYEEAMAYLGRGGDEPGSLHDCRLMTDMEKAADIVSSWIDDHKRIRVIGDYDVDGICSSAILEEGIRLAGGEVDVILPDRVRDGYGLNERLVREACDDGVNTIITCDNGISAFREIELAAELGISVVVTDHHEIPFEIDESGREAEILPPAEAVVDPKRRGSGRESLSGCSGTNGGYPFRDICGAAVAYKFVQALTDVRHSRDGMDMSGVGGPAPEDGTDPDPSDEKWGMFFRKAVVLAGLATVCDVMPLLDENRTLVRIALRDMAEYGGKGLRALIDINGLQPDRLSPYHFGFVIGPCLNATGRMDSAMRGLGLVRSDDEDGALKLANELKALNESRKAMTQEGVDAASAEVERQIGENGGRLPDILVIFLPQTNEAIAGIVAGRIKEKYMRPSLIVTHTDGPDLKGSGRSVACYDLFKGLSACSTLFTKFGGHAMAAGFSIPPENLDMLRQKLNEDCTCSEEDFEGELDIDGTMDPGFFTFDLVRELKLLEPYGTGNRKPLFESASEVEIISKRIVGRDRKVGRFGIKDSSGRISTLICFSDPEGVSAYLEAHDNRMKIAYTPEINVYNGEESLQMVLEDYH